MGLCFTHCYFIAVGYGISESYRYLTFIMASIERWVGDKLHDIMGISDKYVAQYLIGLAAKTNSVDTFITKIKETDTVEVDATFASFANELWNKVRLYFFYCTKTFNYRDSLLDRKFINNV